MSVIDDYLNKVPQPQRDALEHVRTVSMKIVPDAEDTIGYGIPVLKYRRQYLLGFAQFKNHMSIFPGAAPIEALHEELSGYKISRGTVQFTLDNLIPDTTLEEIIKICLERVQARQG